MDNQQLAQQVMLFMRKATIQGSEVEAYAQTWNWISDIANGKLNVVHGQEPEAPPQPKEFGDPQIVAGNKAPSG